MAFKHVILGTNGYLSSYFKHLIIFQFYIKNSIKLIYKSN